MNDERRGLVGRLDTIPKEFSVSPQERERELGEIVLLAEKAVNSRFNSMLGSTPFRVQLGENVHFLALEDYIARLEELEVPLRSHEPRFLPSGYANFSNPEVILLPSDTRVLRTPVEVLRSAVHEILEQWWKKIDVPIPKRDYGFPSEVMGHAVKESILNYFVSTCLHLFEEPITRFSYSPRILGFIRNTGPIHEVISRLGYAGEKGLFLYGHRGDYRDIKGLMDAEYNPRLRAALRRAGWPNFKSFFEEVFILGASGISFASAAHPGDQGVGETVRAVQQMLALHEASGGKLRYMRRSDFREAHEIIKRSGEIMTRTSRSE